MRLVPINKLRPNVELGIDILDENSRVLLKRGHMLNDININRLQTTNISSIYITDKYCYADFSNYTSQPSNILRMVVILKRLARKTRQGTIDKDDVISTLRVVNEIVSTLNATKHTFKIAYEPKKIVSNDFEEKTIYIAIMSTLFALKMGFSKSEASTLCLAALLRDLSLIQPDDKWGRNHLSKNHPIISAKYLKHQYNLPQRVLDIVEQHHELHDGKGYPNKLRGDQIVPGAKILAIIDMYYKIKTTSLTENTSLDVEANFARMMRHFDPEYVEAFLKYVDVYNPDTIVMLSNLDIAVVTPGYVGNPFKPQVKIIESKRFGRGITINLSHLPELKIAKVLYFVE